MGPVATRLLTTAETGRIANTTRRIGMTHQGDVAVTNRVPDGR